ncbi:urea carboxylase-associated protein 2 [Actinoplanes octamycinicus]|uniref:Urea carboxylase-associated protein 2 n=1 Tax=Actinoplanes octamycinicus TaxID=135948 RepID=A0A7W7H0Q0_9ACTN|nr:urea amidolyase associated protein UAAP1 [Actinoplanes octamycinicus]MBB4741747.1 urea carboxylase-associated protein 2 [Actinoplanes octamycinicus]GIE57300.1 urea carboxylase [Actinoplanes octamycinicus]
MSTATTTGAREHARAQGGTVVECMPTVPASTGLTWEETIPGGGYASKRLARGTTLRLTDVHGDACVSVLVFNADEPWERLNVADTVKVLWQAYVGEGHLLLSDQGRALATVTAGSPDRSDTFCGTTTLTSNSSRYGDGSPHSATPAGRELFTLAAAKHGLTRRDLPPSISFFQGVRVGADGGFTWLGSAGPGAVVELRAEMPVTVLLVNVPHPLDPREEYTCSPVRISARPGKPSEPRDARTPEAERALFNTVDYLTARGLA